MPRSTNKSSKSQAQNQTAQILEAVELLVAYQEDESGSRLSEQQDLILDQLDSLEDKLKDLRKFSTNSQPTGKSPGWKTELKQFESRLASRLEKIERASGEWDPEERLVQQIADRVESGLETKILDRLAQIEEQQQKHFDSIRQDLQANQSEGLAADSHDQFESSLATIQEQLELISLQLEDRVHDGEPSAQPSGEDLATALNSALEPKLSQLEARILQQLSANSPEPDKDLLSDIKSIVKKEVSGGSTKLFEVLKQLTSNPGETTDNSHVEDCFVETIESIQQLDVKLTEIQSKLDNPESNDQTVDHSELLDLAKPLEEISERLKSLEAGDSSQNEIIKLIEGMSSISRSDVAEELQTLSETVSEGMAQKLEEVFEQRLSISSETREDVANPEVAPTDDEETASHWHKQKRAMLAKYGIDPDYRPLDEPQQPKKEAKQSIVNDDVVSNKLEELHDTIESISPADSQAIEKLKKELNSKLRDAEVELSINRAKLSQQQAELEQKQAELEQKTADLEARLASSQDNGPEQKESLMSRFARHLRRRK